MRKLFSILCIFFICVRGFAGSLLVSDIDDTIKASHVLNTRDSVANGKRVKNSFAGMSELYNILSRAISDLDFVYLSNAPKALMYLPHSLFLKVNQFPKGQLITRSNYSEADHKIENLRKLLSTKQYDHVLFIGDNGQQDILIYNQIAQEFPQIQIQTYIHLVYDSYDVLEPGLVPAPFQIGYVSAIDIAHDLSLKNIIPTNEAIDFSNQIIPVLISKPLDKYEGSVAFAEWQKCSDYQSSLSNFPALSIVDFNIFVQNRCHNLIP